MTTETDRELLELAAKAAGMDDAEFSSFPGMEFRYGYTQAIWSYKLEAETGFGYWNPLLSDGSALRLAVKLQIHITQSMQHVVCRQADQFRAIEIAGDDREKATRRAIVRAAAEIGRAMK